MGAWDIGVLNNDAALDAMYDFEETIDIKGCTKKYLESDYIDEALLAVEIIDISLNGVDKEILGGFYGYEGFFKKVEKVSMPELKEDAIKTLHHIQKGDTGWTSEVSRKRKSLLKKIEKRLKLKEV